MKTRNLQFWLAAAFLAIAAAAAHRAGAADVGVRAIRIEGNRQVTASKILHVLDLRRGVAYDPQAIRDALKRLYATKQFRDVAAWRESTEFPDSVVVVVRVEEYPRVDDVRFEGSDHLDEEELRKAIHAGKGTFVRPAVTGRDRDAILDAYREKGYYRAAVRDTIVHEDGKGDVLVYRIAEGEKVRVRHIDFVGARGVDTDELRKVMKTRESRWLRGSDFNPDELEKDRERIVALYRSRGFLDAEVRDVDLEFSDDGRALDVFVTIDEGRRYYVGDVAWEGNTLLPDTTIASLVTLRRGEPFDESELARIQQAIGNRYWDRGYIYSAVTPVRRVRGDTVDVTLSIEPGSLAHVREINIVGNTKTAEEVIRRELVLMPGDVFSASRLRRSLREVFALGFFAGPPEPSFEPADSGDIDLTLRVQEKPAGQFRMGAGYAQLNGVSGFLGITEPNFMGRGIRVGIDWEFSKFRQNINLQFTQPWFMGSPTTVAASVFSMNQNQVRQQFYDDRRTGFSVRVGRPLPWLDYSSAFVNYRFEEVELSNFSEFYQGPLRSVQWPQTTSSLELTFLRNSTDNPFHPTAGSQVRLSARWSGGLLGGDVSFQRYVADVSWYARLFWKAALRVRINTGLLDSYGSANGVPDYELFRLGGNRRYALRGYDFFEVVPEGNPQFIGGRFMNVVSYEVTWPIAEPSVYGALFYDVGNTWNSFRGADILDVRRGAGVGLRIELPMLGTVGLDYGYGFDRVGGARWEPHLTFGGSF